MATYHVSLAGSNTSPYDTWAKAANSPKTILALALTGNNIMLVDEGTYINPSGTFLAMISAKHANFIILGSKFGETEGVEGSRDIIIFNAGANRCLDRAQDNIVVENITLKADVGQINDYTHACSDAVLKNVRVLGKMSYSSAVDFSINRCLVENSQSVAYGLDIQLASSGNVLFSVITGEKGVGGSGIYCRQSGVVNLINLSIFQNNNYGVLQGGAAGTTNIYNSLFIANSLSLSSYPVNRTNGTLNTYNCAVMGGGYDVDDRWINGATIEEDTLKNPNAKLNTTRREGYIIPCIDDAGRLGYAQLLQGVLDSYGYKGTWYFDGATWEELYSGSNTELRTMVSDGVMEIANHSWSHVGPDTTVAFTVSYTGGDANPTVALVAGTPRNIQLRTTEGNDDADISLTANPTFGAIQDAIDALNWSVSIPATYSNRNGLATSLDVVAAQSAPYGLLLLKTDETEGFYKDECVDSKPYFTNLINAAGDVTDGQTGLTYICNSFATPFVHNDVGYRAATKVAGHTSCRAAGTAHLVELDHYIMATCSISNAVVTGDEAATKRLTRALCQNAVLGGMVIYLLSHSEGSANAEDWGWVCEVFAEFPELNVTSSQLAVEDILDKADSYDEPTGISTRSFTPQTDFSILKGSECINTGLNDPFLINGTPGADLVVNGDFATDTVWSKGVGWSIAGGVAVCDGTQTNARSVYQDVGTSKSLFKVTWDLVSRSAGSASSKFRSGGDQGPSQITPGTYIDYLYQAESGDIAIEGDADFVGSIDNVICEAMTGVINIKDIVGNPITDESGNIVASGDIVDIGAFEYQQLLPSDINIISQQEYAGVTLYIIPSNNMKPIEED